MNTGTAKFYVDKIKGFSSRLTFAFFPLLFWLTLLSFHCFLNWRIFAVRASGTFIEA